MKQAGGGLAGARFGFAVTDAPWQPGLPVEVCGDWRFQCCAVVDRQAAAFDELVASRPGE
jgi:hypothetical protein